MNPLAAMTDQQLDREIDLELARMKRKKPSSISNVRNPSKLDSAMGITTQDDHNAIKRICRVASTVAILGSVTATVVGTKAWVATIILANPISLIFFAGALCSMIPSNPYEKVVPINLKTTTVISAPPPSTSKKSDVPMKPQTLREIQRNLFIQLKNQQVPNTPMENLSPGQIKGLWTQVYLQTAHMGIA